jgi:putative ABC transport system permease protein
MNKIAIRMLLGDRAKCIMLISGLTFASLLMTQNGAVFCGLMRWTTATIRNVDVPIWVVDSHTEEVSMNQMLRDTSVGLVRSVEGVEWAVPFTWVAIQARLKNGDIRIVEAMGLDNSTLVGRPKIIVQGRLEDIFLPNAVIVDTQAQRQYGLSMGDTFLINDHFARVVGICKAEHSFFSYPHVYMPMERLVEFSPTQRRFLSYVLVKPKQDENVSALLKRIRNNTGLEAYTSNEFEWKTIFYYIKNTGIPVALGSTVILGFIVGLAVSAQTFQTFILENLRNLAAIKAMGARNRTIVKMLVLQISYVGIVGYGLGVGLATLFGLSTLEKGEPSFYMPYQLLFISFVSIFLICAFSASLGIRKVARAEPAIVFR